MSTKNNQQKGFTLLEILLVVAAIAILAGIVIVALNPGKQLGETRDGERRSDINTLMNATYQYSIDNNGDFPAAIDTATDTVQVIGTGSSCTCDATAAEGTCVDLSGDLVPTYLAGIPTDPRYGSAEETKYYINRTADERIVVGACSPEESNAIEIIR